MLDKDELQLEELTTHITTNVSLLECCNRDWANLLKDLKGDEKVEAEEKEYHRVADGSEGYIELLFYGL